LTVLPAGSNTVCHLSLMCLLRGRGRSATKSKLSYPHLEHNQQRIIYLQIMEGGVWSTLTVYASPDLPPRSVCPYGEPRWRIVPWIVGRL